MIKKLREMPVTLILAAINIGVFIADIFLGGRLMLEYGLVSEYFFDGKYYTIITSMFLHFDFTHIFSNMFMLIGIGNMIERYTGHVKFLLIYLFSGFCGGILVLNISEADSFTIGASGAIFGLVSAYFVLAYLYKDFSGLRNAAMCIILNLICTFSDESISIGSHVGGLLGGLLISFLILRDREV